MKKFFEIMLPALILATPAFAQQQNYDKVWIQGGGGLVYKTDFTATGPDNQFWDTTGTKPDFVLGHSNICDANGDLLLATTSGILYGANGNIIQNGDSLLFPLYYQDWQASNGSQSSIILPLGDSIYYVFVSTQSDTAYYYWVQGAQDSTATDDFLLYHVVDMKQNGYAGKVVKKKQVALGNTYISSGQLTACRHGNGKDWWVIKQGWGSNKVYKFLVKKDTVMGPYLQSFSQPVGFTSTSNGQSTFSNDGRTYAVTCNNLTRTVFLADFDRCSGLLSNPRTYYTPYGPIGSTTALDNSTVCLAFSPNDSFLYVGGVYNIHQLELNNPDSATAWVHIANMDTIFSAFLKYMMMQRGHNNKIYVGHFHSTGSAISAIDKPNLKGAACEFCPQCLQFPPFHSYGAVTKPPNMPNYNLGAVTPPCETEGVNEIPGQMAVRIYPNPADGSLTVVYEKEGRFELSDMMGRSVGSWQLAVGKIGYRVVISTKELPAGVYVYRLITREGTTQSGKVIIEH